MMIFQMVQLFFEIFRMDIIHAVIPNLIQFILFPYAVLTQWCYLRDRSKFLAFFDDWHRLECELVASSTDGFICRSKKMHNVMYAAYVCLMAITFTFTGIDFIDHSGSSYLLSTYKVLVDVLTLPTLGAIQLLTLFIVWILLTMADFVPAFCFYHAALAIRQLEKDVRVVFEKLTVKNEERIGHLSVDVIYLNISLHHNNLDDHFRSALHNIWKRLEHINRMTERANKLFGKLVAFGHCVAVVMISALLYSTLYYFKDVGNGLADRVACLFMNLVGFTVRLVSCSLITSTLQRAARQMRITMTFLLSEHWEEIRKKDRDLVFLFHGRLQHQCDTLSASPLGLYNVTPSILLSILSVVVSYVIVLITSKQQTDEIQ